MRQFKVKFKGEIYLVNSKSTISAVIDFHKKLKLKKPVKNISVFSK